MDAPTPPAPLRLDLSIAPREDGAGTSTVYCPRSGRRFELPSEALLVARAFDGKRTIPQIADRVADDGGPWVAHDVVASLAADLQQLGLLERKQRKFRKLGDPPPSQWQVAAAPTGLPLHVHSKARFQCDGVGTCCRSGYVIPLDLEAKDRVVRAAKRLKLGTDGVVLLPTRAGQRWTYALDNDPACPFLGEDSGCRIHGRAAQPAACRVFPLTFVRAGRAVHGSVSHRCGCGALNRGALLSDQRRALRRRMELGPVPRLYARTKLDDAGHTVGLDVAEALAEVTERHRSAVALVSAAWAAAVRVPPSGGTSRQGLAGLRRKLLPWVDPDDYLLRAALSGAQHPHRPLIERDLRQAGLHHPRASARAEIARFARDHLFGLRPYQHGSLVRGLFALTWAVADLSRHEDAPHPEVRMRIMLWEDAFVSPTLRAVVGPSGPLTDALSDAGAARAWSERLLAAA